MKPVVEACFPCGAVFDANADATSCCPRCGLDLAGVTLGDRQALETAWLEDQLDELTYERILGALNEALAEANAEAAKRQRYPKLKLRAVTFAEACAFIEAHHRHHPKPQGWKFGIGLEDPDNQLQGVITVGRPVARMLATKDPTALEVTRCCVRPGTPNGASMLYGAAWRTAQKLGCKRLITYTLDTEPGTSLKAAGWRCVATSPGGSWSRSRRSRTDKAPTQPKRRWEKLA